MKVITVPFSSGGVTTGPAKLPEHLVPRLRQAGFEFDLIEVYGASDPVAEPPGTMSREEMAKWLGKAGDVIRSVVSDPDLGKEPLLVIGGDHTISAGTFSGYTDGDPLGVLWLDAHPDLNNEETSPSGNPHGMSLRAILGGEVDHITNLGGFSPKGKHGTTALVGIRNIDLGESDFWEFNPEMLWVTAEQAIDLGPETAARNVAEQLEGTRVVISLDLDVLDPIEFPTVSTPDDNGLSISYVESFFQHLRGSIDLLALEIVEVDLNRPEGPEYLGTVVRLIEACLGSPESR